MPDRNDIPNGTNSDGGWLTTREVVVPLAVYKPIVVFSTIFAILSVVAGFIALDMATRRASLPASQVDPILTVVGLGLIAAGAIIYAFASRFRAPGMGKPKDSGIEEDNDG